VLAGVLPLGKHMAGEAADGGTLVHLVAAFGALELLRFLVKERGADAGQEGWNRSGTPLHVALKVGRQDTSLFLVEEGGGGVDCEHPFGRLGYEVTPLIMAARAGMLPVVKALVARKVRLHVQSGGERRTALGFAADGNHEEVGLALVAAARSIANEPGGGHDAAVAAARAGLPRLVAAIVRRMRADGVEPRAVEAAVSAAAIAAVAVKSGGAAVLRALLEAGLVASRPIPVRRSERLGVEVLLLVEACRAGNREAAELLLLDRRCDPRRHDALVQVLLEEGRADPHLRSGEMAGGRRASEMAAMNGHGELAAFLREQEAAWDAKEAARGLGPGAPGAAAAAAVEEAVVAMRAAAAPEPDAEAEAEAARRARNEKRRLKEKAKARRRAAGGREWGGEQDGGSDGLAAAVGSLAVGAAPGGGGSSSGDNAVPTAASSAVPVRLPPLDEFLEADAPDQLICPITMQLVEEPVVLVGDGCTYSKAAIQQHIDYCRQSACRWKWGGGLSVHG
jgi:hypothetical protein